MSSRALRGSCEEGAKRACIEAKTTSERGWRDHATQATATSKQSQAPGARRARTGQVVGVRRVVAARGPAWEDGEHRHQQRATCSRACCRGRDGAIHHVQQVGSRVTRDAAARQLDRRARDASRGAVARDGRPRRARGPRRSIGCEWARRGAAERGDARCSEQGLPWWDAKPEWPRKRQTAGRPHKMAGPRPQPWHP